MGVLPLCADLFCFTLLQGVAGTVSDPVVIAQVSQMKVVSSNSPVHSFSSCYGVVTLKLLCDPPLRVSGRWVGGSESGWVG